jgi:predicted RNA-binding Zn ribbon-like protein
MRIDRSFSWLGRFPLGVDLADTVRVVGSQEIELLIDERALATWVAAELSRFPTAEGALGHLAEVRTLRSAVRQLLLARTTGAPLPRKELDRINDASARCPNFPVVTDEGHRASVELNDDPFDIFCAAVSRSTMETLDDHSAPLAICHAPSCGMFFVPANRRQRWCSPGCGNRARVARHAARAGHGQGDG